MIKFYDQEYIDMLDNVLQLLRDGITSIFDLVVGSWVVSWTELGPLTMWILLQLVIIALLILAVKWFKNSKFTILFESFVEEMYKFFEEILEKTGKAWIKMYIVTLFFIILLINLSSWILDVVRVIFKDIDGVFQFISIPTADFNFNIAMAIISIVLLLWIQLRHLKPIKFLHEYLPITGKGILTISKKDVSWFAYYPVAAIIKVFDIWISMFVWLLDIIGIAAKVISLSARLYGNMLAGGILLWLLVMWVNSATIGLGIGEFPILAPLILYAQGLLVAVIQAFVFPLLVAIFIKIAKDG